MTGHDIVLNPMLNPGMGLSPIPGNIPSCDCSVESVMAPDVNLATGTPTTPTIQVGVIPQDGRGSLTTTPTPPPIQVGVTSQVERGSPTGTPTTPLLQVGVRAQCGRCSPTGTPTTPLNQVGVRAQHGRGTPTTPPSQARVAPQAERGAYPPDPKPGMEPFPSLHKAGSTAGVAVCDVTRVVTDRSHAHALLAEQIDGQMHSNCIEEEEEEDSISSLGVNMLGQLTKYKGAFWTHLQDSASLGVPSAAELAAEAAAEESWALATSSGVAATAVEEPEPVAASDALAATAMEEPATPESCSTLTLLSHASSAAASLPSLESFQTPLPCQSSSSVGPHGLPFLLISSSSAAAAADGVPRSCPSSGSPTLLAVPHSSKEALSPSCSLSVSEAVQEDSRSDQQPHSCQQHLTTAQSVRLCEDAKRALLKELAGIQVTSYSKQPLIHSCANSR